jgi:MoaA/NifB/PqqE/SkfB family radical SAM enzyme
LFFLRRRQPTLDWLQIEVTSRCNAACIYCPRTVHSKPWINRDMSWSTFAQLTDAFTKTELVFLQGWGEPLLHPRLLDMADEAKRAGCRVGLSTNGTLIDGQKAEDLIRCGIDVVGVSLAGTDNINDRFRRGAHLDRVLEAIRAVRRAKERLGSSRPAIHIAFLLLRSGLPEITRLPELAADTGVSQVIISTLDFVPSHELEGEALHPGNPKAYGDIRSRLDAVRAEGRRRGVEIHAQISYPGQRALTCTENARRAAFISSDGSVSPCVFANLPASEAACFRGGRPAPYARRIFGNVNEQPFVDIWRSRPYMRFREAFFSKTVDPACRECPKLYIDS